MSDDEAVGAAAASCVDLLRASASTLATAESLTAGLVCATVAAVPGASDVLRGGLAAYATDVKTALLKVDPELVARHGVISAECAEAMAAGAVDLFGSTWGLSATGVAGPARQEDRPPGTVFVAVAGPDGRQARELALPGTRNEVRRASVAEALDLLVSVLVRADRGRPAQAPASGG